MMQNKLIAEISAMRNIDKNPPVITFAEYYGMDITKYEHIYIEECDFSTRLYNALRGKCQITKLSELFSMTLYNFAKTKGLGITSIDELDNYLSNIVTKDNSNMKNHSVHKTHNPIPSIIVKHKDDIACGDFSFIKNEALGESDVDTVMEYKDAYEVLGDELVFDCVLEPNKIFPIVSMLNDFFSQFEKNKKYNEQLNQLLEQLPQDRLKQNSEHYIRAYTKDADKQDCIFNLYDKNDASIDAIVKHSFEEERDFVEACRFISWCNFDIKENIQSLFDVLYKNENQKIIIETRAQGKTLEQSGHLIGVTRERVRQIEKKIKERFLVWQSKNRLLMKIMAVRNGDSILTALELADYFEEYTSVLLYMLRNTPSKTYTYDSYLDVFIMGNDDLSAQVQEFVEQLPDTFKYEEYEEEINKLDSDNELPKELVLKAIHEEFDITGTVYHRNRLSLTEIYKTVINKFYPDGIKVYDETEIEKFRQVIINNYGNVSLPKNNRAISARLADIGVLCGRGIYKPQQEKYIPIELEQKILKYITESNSVIFLTNTLFSVFEEELIKYGIDNKYYLQGVLHQLFGDKFVFRRDYISKDDSVSSIYVAIMEFIKKCDYPISKQEIKNAFPGITEMVLNLAINETGILNYFGEYLHTSKLRLYDYDKTYFATGATAQAKFVEQESTITLNANGGYIGSGYMGTKTEIELETEKGRIKLPFPYRTSDYDFEGWYTEDGEKVTSKTEYYEDTTLNAKWNIIGQRTLTFASDGGSDILPLTTKYGDMVNLENVIPTKQGFTFKGWYTDPRTKQNRVNEITMTENITVYALWEQTSNAVNVIGKDRVYMTDEEIAMRTETLKRQYPPTLSNNQITKLIQLLQNLLKQTDVQQPTPQPTQTTIGESVGDINKIVANME